MATAKRNWRGKTYPDHRRRYKSFALKAKKETKVIGDDVKTIQNLKNI